MNFKQKAERLYYQMLAKFKTSFVFRVMFWFSVCGAGIGYLAVLIILFLPSFHRLSIHNKNVIVGIIYIISFVPIILMGLVRGFVGLKFKLSLIKLEILKPALGDLSEIYYRTRFRQGIARAGFRLCVSAITISPQILIQSIALMFSGVKVNQALMNRSIYWFKQMVEASECLLTEEDKKSLEEWDRTMVDGSGRYATSDWPGWEKYIGLPPWKQKR